MNIKQLVLNNNKPLIYKILLSDSQVKAFKTKVICCDWLEFILENDSNLK